MRIISNLIITHIANFFLRINKKIAANRKFVYSCVTYGNWKTYFYVLCVTFLCNMHAVLYGLLVKYVNTHMRACLTAAKVSRARPCFICVKLSSSSSIWICEQRDFFPLSVDMYIVEYTWIEMCMHECFRIAQNYTSLYLSVSNSTDHGM